jgi:hypothetical protein
MGFRVRDRLEFEGHAMNFAPPGGLTDSRQLGDVFCVAECAMSAPLRQIQGGDVSKPVTRTFRFGVVCPLTSDLRAWRDRVRRIADSSRCFRRRRRRPSPARALHRLESRPPARTRAPRLVRAASSRNRHHLLKARPRLGVRGCCTEWHTRLSSLEPQVPANARKSHQGRTAMQIATKGGYRRNAQSAPLGGNPRAEPD